MSGGRSEGDEKSGRFYVRSIPESAELVSEKHQVQHYDLKGRHVVHRQGPAASYNSLPLVYHGVCFGHAISDRRSAATENEKEVITKSNWVSDSWI